MIKAKKSLGQNFLIDKNIINKIVNTIEIKNKNILEIGPGTGNLTSSLLEKCPKKFYVIEKDSHLSRNLEEKFKGKLIVMNDDILNINENLISDHNLIVFGNLPYNISTEILCKWILNLDYQNLWFSNLILMFQKEVADRIISKFESPNYGRLSILAKWRLEIKKITDVRPNCFFPRPKVESSLLFFTPKKKFTRFDDPKNLEKITRVFFNHRRKMIKKSFFKIFPKNEELLKKLQINLDLRPHNLDFETYYNLTTEFEKLQN